MPWERQVTQQQGDWHEQDQAYCFEGQNEEGGENQVVKADASSCVAA
jgi:hypothetical protein